MPDILAYGTFAAIYLYKVSLLNVLFMYIAVLQIFL